MVFIIPIVIAAILGLAMLRPDTFRLQRTLVIAAPAERVFDLVNNFHEWSRWSPWEKLDPAMTRSFSGADGGVGAIYNWLGNSKVGEGRMEITRSTPASNVLIQLDFVKPFAANNISEFVLLPQAGGTAVTWSMTGQTPFVMKVMHLVVSMDKMVGKDFERGLANLKGVAEAA